MKGIIIADGDVNFAFVPFANLAFVTVRLSTGWPLLCRRVHPTTRHASVKHACLFSVPNKAFLQDGEYSEHVLLQTAEYSCAHCVLEYSEHVQTAEYSEHVQTAECSLSTLLSLCARKD